MDRELARLVAALDGLRSGVRKKLSGLSDADARRSTVESGTNLAGLIQHLTFVESLWFLVVIQETARHAGHADILREQIDGETGR